VGVIIDGHLREREKVSVHINTNHLQEEKSIMNYNRIRNAQYNYNTQELMY